MSGISSVLYHNPQFHQGYNSSISACEKAGQWETATNLLGVLQRERMADTAPWNLKM